MLVKAASASTASAFPATAPTGAVRFVSGWTISPGSSQSPAWTWEGRGGDGSWARPSWPPPPNEPPTNEPPINARATARVVKPTRVLLMPSSSLRDPRRPARARRGFQPLRGWGGTVADARTGRSAPRRRPDPASLLDDDRPCHLGVE